MAKEQKTNRIVARKARRENFNDVEVNLKGNYYACRPVTCGGYVYDRGERLSMNPKTRNYVPKPDLQSMVARGIVAEERDWNSIQKSEKKQADRAKKSLDKKREAKLAGMIAEQKVLRGK